MGYAFDVTILLNPSTLFVLIGEIAEVGAWSLQGDLKPTGIFLYMFWAVEAGIIVIPAMLAAANHGIAGRQVGWIVVAMFGARNAAMSFNRLVDHSFDAANPRTADRELPAGRLSPTTTWLVTFALGALFVFASSLAS